MSNQTNRILDEISEGEEFTEAHTPYSESLEKNIRRSEKFRQCNAGEDRDSIIQQNDEIITSLNQQLRNAEATVLRLQNLQRARFLKQQAQNIAARVQVLRSDFTEPESSEMFSLKDAGAVPTSAQSLAPENLSGTAIDVLLSQIFLSFKFKIIKSEKMRVYKDQSENEHQRWFRNAKIKMMSASKYFVTDKVKIF